MNVAMVHHSGSIQSFRQQKGRWSPAKRGGVVRGHFGKRWNSWLRDAVVAVMETSGCSPCALLRVPHAPPLPQLELMYRLFAFNVVFILAFGAW